MTTENRDLVYLKEQTDSGMRKLAAAHKFIETAEGLGEVMPLHEILDAMWLAMLASAGPGAADVVQALSVVKNRA